MMTIRLCGGLVATILTCGVALGADGERNPNRFSVRGGVSLNIKTEFTSTAPTPQIGAAAGNADRIYDDGYARVDISGNAGGQTWFWGYQDNAQYTAGAGGPGSAGSTLAFHSAPSPADGVVRSGKKEADPGFEMSYARDLGSFNVWNGRRAVWGLEGTFGYTYVSRRDAGRVTGTVLLTTDTYNVPTGTIPPLAPYSGTFAGPGPLLDVAAPATPFVRTGPAPAAATADVINQLNVDLFVCKLGPSLELPLHDRVSLTLGGGLVAVMARQDYSFSQNIAVTGGATTTRSGNARDDAWHLGGSVYAQLGWRLNDRWSINGGIEYLHAGRSSLTAATGTSTLNLNQVLKATLGVNYSF